MESLMEFVIRFGFFCATFGGSIAVLTTVTCVVMGGVFLFFHRRVLKEEAWAKYFGWAFLTWAIHYFLRFLQLKEDLLNWVPMWAWDAYTFFRMIFESAASPVNNFLFISAGVSLLAINETSRKVSFVIVFFLGLSFVLNFFGGPMHRIPDGILSSLTLLFLGFTLFVNFQAKSRVNTWLAGLLNIGGALAYSLFAGFFALTPELSQHLGGTSVYVSLNQEYVQQARLKGWDPGLQIVCDNFLIAGSFCLKIGIFLGGFLLVQKCLMSLLPNRHNTMDGVTLGDVDFLSNKGLPQYMYDLFNAQIAKLLIVSPGKGETALSYSWPVRSSEPTWEAPDGFDRYILKNRIHSRNVDAEPAMKALFTFEPPKSFIGEPIRFHGQNVGFLYVGWDKKWSFSATTLARLRQLAESLSQVVHTKRQQHALEQLTQQLDMGRSQDFRSVALRVLKKVMEVLNPHGVGIYLDHELARLCFYWDGSECHEAGAEESFEAFKQRFEKDPSHIFEGELAFKPLYREEPNSGSFFFVDPKGGSYSILLRNPTFRMAVVKTVHHILAETIAAHNQKELSRTLVQADRPAVVMHEFKGSIGTLDLGLKNMELDLNNEALWAEDWRDVQETLREDVTHARKTLDHIGRIGRILDPSKMNQFTGKGSFQQRELTEMLAKTYTEIADIKGVDLQFSLDPEKRVNLSLDVMYLAVSNLMGNAIDATGKGGTIQLRDGPDQSLEVANPGTIDTSITSRIFERGFTNKRSGSGLGLPLSRAALRDLGGNLILAENGTGWVVFRISFPIREEGEGYAS